MINFIIFQEGDTQQNWSVIALLVLIALVVVGLGAFVGYKAFQPKNKK